MTQSATRPHVGDTSTAKVLSTEKKQKPWHPQDQGGACRWDRTNDWVPPMYNDDAYTPIPSFVITTCGRCSFKEACLEWAMKNDAYGFWGGTSRYQRLQLEREQHRVKCPGCASDAVVVLGMNEVCMGCGLSWAV